MYSLFLTNSISKYLADNFTKYEVASNDKSLSNYYKGTTKNNESFVIKVYNTGTVTIEGSLKDRVYSTLFNLIEEDGYCGYDEVGVGDFFGPTVYVSTSLTKDTIKTLADLHLPIRDSKKLKDSEILVIYDKLKDIVKYNCQIVYDKDIDNLNSIEQKMVYHNKNIDNNSHTHVIDLFTTLNAFEKYTHSLNLTFPKNLILINKADSIYYSVALSSIIARAIFIKEMNKLVDKYDFDFKYGANVKDQAVEFANIYSKEELSTFCKTSFKTFNEI